MEPITQDEMPPPSNDPEVTETYVRHRLDDWFKRLGTLLSDIRVWGHNHGWTVEDAAPIPMNEEIMQRFDIDERLQPAMTLRDPSHREIWVWPKALWVIGANGRVDIFSRKGVFVLIDRAEPFQPPQWCLYKAGQGYGRVFDPDQLEDVA